MSRNDRVFSIRISVEFQMFCDIFTRVNSEWLNKQAFFISEISFRFSQKGLWMASSVRSGKEKRETQYVSKLLAMSFSAKLFPLITENVHFQPHRWSVRCSAIGRWPQQPTEEISRYKEFHFLLLRRLEDIYLRILAKNRNWISLFYLDSCEFQIACSRFVLRIAILLKNNSGRLRNLPPAPQMQYF